MQSRKHSMRKFCVTSLAAVAVVLFSATAQAVDQRLLVEGTVTEVNDSPFAGGTPTAGISVSDVITGSLKYDDSTGQASGGLISYELVALSLTVPDTTQGGGNFQMIPDALNTATRIVFSGSTFQGLLLPNNVTGFEDLDVFDLTGVDFESSGFLGPDFKFNLGTPVVEGVFTMVPVPPVPSMTATGRAILVVVFAGLFALQTRTPRSGRKAP